MLNVALIIERIEAWRGGAETSTLQFVGQLARQGCQVTVITTSHPPSTPDMVIVPIRVWAPRRARRTQLFALRAAEYVRDNAFDIVHSMMPCPIADVYQPRGGTVPETLLRNRAIRTSLLPRTGKWLGQRLSSKYRVLHRLEENLLNRRPSPWVIAISDYVHRQFGEHYHFPDERIRDIFNAIEPDQTPPDQRKANRVQIRRQLGMVNGEVMILCVAHNFKLKGVPQLIEALGRLQGQASSSALPSYRLVIVGSGNPKPLHRLAGRLKVSDRILFAGPTQRINAYFHAADLLAHPTFYDPCSRVVLEAMDAGLPAITTRYNGAAEKIIDGQNGYVLDSPHDIEGLADRLVRLMDAEHRLACARRAREAVADLTMANHAQAVLALYEQILAENEEYTTGPKEQSKEKSTLPGLADDRGSCDLPVRQGEGR